MRRTQSTTNNIEYFTFDLSVRGGKRAKCPSLGARLQNKNPTLNFLFVQVSGFQTKITLLRESIKFTTFILDASTILLKFTPPFANFDRTIPNEIDFSDNSVGLYFQIWRQGSRTPSPLLRRRYDFNTSAVT